MGPEVIFYTFLLLMGLVFLRVHIGIALGVASVVGVFLAYGDIEIALSVLSSTAYEAIRTDSLMVIPLFVLMGEVVSKAGAATCLLYTSPSPRDRTRSRMPSSA